LLDITAEKEKWEKKILACFCMAVST